MVTLCSKAAVEDVLGYGELENFRHGSERVPEAIKNAKLEIKAAYLRGFFDSQGSVAINRSGAGIVEAVKSVRNPIILEEIKDLLSDVGIHSGIFLKARARVIKIWRREAVDKFAGFINFSIRRKREKLGQVVARPHATPSKTVTALVPRMIELHKQELTCGEIGDRLGLARETVRKRLKKEGISTIWRRPQQIDQLVSKMRELRSAGLSYREIGRRLKVDRTTIRMHIG